MWTRWCRQRSTRENVIDVSYINQDIQMFNASEGHYPKDLQELIPNYLAKCPTCPWVTNWFTIRTPIR